MSSIGTAEVSPAALFDRVQTLRDEVADEGGRQLAAWRPQITRAAFLPSALNLAHYLALRRRDLRELQLDLMPFGLSSLGRCESHVLPNLDAVLGALSRMSEGVVPRPYPGSEAFFAGSQLLAAATEEILGPAPPARTVRIMVTLPSEAADDAQLVRRLLASGADLVRINCAHDGPDAWRTMAANARHAAAELGRFCGVCADVAGPKLRVERVASREPMPERGPRVKRGDRFLLGDLDIAPSADVPLAIRSSIPQLAARVKLGARVSVDDGKLSGAVVEVRGDALLVEVVEAPDDGLRMRPERGLNFPDSELGLAPLTDKDLDDLKFVAAEADMVGYSFVTSAADVELMLHELDVRQAGPRKPALVLKIETDQAVRNLPSLIVAAAGRAPAAVMIARGDLAVNIGYRRLAEIQEEILWLCESAHIPVIWATQVLERLVKKGSASRGEFTDAAMAERAECVMLNKGPYLADAVVALSDVLSRMEGHQSKKTSRLRPLRVWESALS
jgi:pyruvate kinase